MRKAIAVAALLTYTLFASQPPLQVPPGDLPADNVPMFISLGFDDNSHSGMPNSTSATGGVKWVVDMCASRTNPAGTGNSATYDGTPVLSSFYSNSFYMLPYNGDYSSLVKWSHNYAYMMGHEIGNHTHSHITGGNGASLDVASWEAEMTQCTERLIKPAPTDSTSLMDHDSLGAGIPRDDIVGFRSPYLRYGDATFTAITNQGMLYDCSIEEGLDPSQDGTDFYWPYTLDYISPGHLYMVNVAGTKEMSYQTASHPNVWELPCYAVILPPDSLCAQYGIPTGFRDRMAAHYTGLGKSGSFDASNGKLTGLDYNWYYFQEANISKDEMLAILKYTLDLRMQGNRAPMLLGVHSQYYTTIWNTNATNVSSEADRQAIIEEFMDYALTTYADVRITTMENVMEWCKDPQPLRPTTPVENTPNPKSIKPHFVVQGSSVEFATSKAITAELLAVNGQRLMSKTLTPVNGFCRWDIGTSMATGNYIVRIDNFSKPITIR